MKLYLLFAFCLLTTTLFAQQPSPSGNANQDYKKLVQQLKKGEVYLIDVRTPEEYNEGNLEYSQNIDYKGGNFNDNLNKLDKKKPVYVYCRSGNRSGKSLDSLKALGFSKYYNIGGFENLKAEGMPVKKQ
ncbi:rhodanese-like domain-containing protein [Sporocytophaga myxococcoides]|uniref:rhodanese-like domain-containing protein n=1 Tax=Sporocytophaga myxococcoides TaxID=153721 RepID=UPI000426F84C|nr:rhodanese-like domain-containing protein [Sporocytophaga myxococcoides]